MGPLLDTSCACASASQHAETSFGSHAAQMCRRLQHIVILLALPCRALRLSRLPALQTVGADLLVRVCACAAVPRPASLVGIRNETGARCCRASVALQSGKRARPT